MHRQNISAGRFVARHQQIGHIRTYRRAGNDRAEREIEENMLIHIALYRDVPSRGTSSDNQRIES